MTNDGPHYPLPYAGEGAIGLGKPLKPIVHPLRADLPIWLGAEGPEERRPDRRDRRRLDPDLLHAEVGRHVPAVARRGVRPARRPAVPRADFEIAATCHLQVVADAEEKAAVIDAMRPFVSLYMGGMGAKEQNFHNQVFVRMGYEDLAAEVQKLYLNGEKDRATALIPDELVDDMHIIGTAAEVKERVAQWEETGVTTLLLSLHSPDEVRAIAELLA